MAYGNQTGAVPTGITYGGTGVSTVTTAPTSNAFAGWDINENLSANNVIKGYATTATAAGTTTLFVSSANQQLFTGTSTQTVVLPVTSTLVLGHTFNIVNNSTGAVTVQSSGANAILVLAAGTSGVFTCILTSGTTAASWSASVNGISSLGTAAQVWTSNGAGQAPTFQAASGGGLTWSSAASGTQAMTANNGYYVNNGASVVAFTLPSTCAAGTVVQIAGYSSGGWTLAQNASQSIIFGNATTTTGTGGSIASSNNGDGVALLCVVANLTFVALPWVGNPSYV